MKPHYEDDCCVGRYTFVVVYRPLNPCKWHVYMGDRRVEYFTTRWGAERFVRKIKRLRRRGVQVRV